MKSQIADETSWYIFIVSVINFFYLRTVYLSIVTATYVR